VCDGVSLLRANIPNELYERYALDRLVHRRSDTADEELWFLFDDRSLKAACLPVLHNGEVEVYEWGNRDQRVRKLPQSGLCHVEMIEQGLWLWLYPEKVTILANLALQNGVWYTVKHGIEGFVVRDDSNRHHVYMLTGDATHYYRIMTGKDRCPLLIKQVI
jgi:hypothetical protein